MTIASEVKKTKTIASNTVYLLIRMLLITLLNLYIVRIVIKGLGVDDYGLFNTIAGVVTIGSFINGVLSLSVQRFYSYYMGKNELGKQMQTYSACVNILILFSLLLIAVFETAGLWFVETYLNIPAHRITAVIWLFHFSLLTFLLSLLQIPYTAAIFAHEDIKAYSLISTIECLLRLAAALMIGQFFFDNLMAYGLWLLVGAVLTFAIYMVYAKTKYEECSYQRTIDRKLYKDLLSFSGWTLFGSVANVGMQQGNIIILNIFFGTLINAAFAVAMQIYNTFNTLCSSIIIPLRPAMIKAYVEQNYTFLNRLFSISNKLLLYILPAIGTPLALEMPTILKAWLNLENDNFTLFAQLSIIYVFFLSLNNPITTIVQASGKIREYHLKVESVTLLCLPASMLFFYMGLPPYFVFVAMIGLCITAHAIRLHCLSKSYSGFSIRSYLISLVLPAAVTWMVVASISYAVHISIDNPILRLTIILLSSPVLYFISALYLGTDQAEKELLRKFFTSFANNRLCRR